MHGGMYVCVAAVLKKKKNAEPGECDARTVKYELMPQSLAALSSKRWEGVGDGYAKTLSRWVL